MEKWTTVRIKRETVERLQSYKEHTGASFAFVVDKAITEFLEKYFPDKK